MVVQFQKSQLCENLPPLYRGLICSMYKLVAPFQKSECSVGKISCEIPEVSSVYGKCLQIQKS